ncbi:MAG: ATP-binding protein [Elusimicrobiota bacterium]|nr:MAG: ATP-binding protein [Elusimicrobiota bacterium]
MIDTTRAPGMRLIQLQRRARRPDLDPVPGAGGPHWAARYAAAAALVGLSVAANVAAPALIGQPVPFFVYFPAVVLSGFIGGFGPGLAATGLSALAVAWLNLPPPGPDVGAHDDRLRLLLFTGVCALLSYVNHVLHSAVRAARRAEAGLAAEAARNDRTEAKYRTLFDSMDEGFCIIEMIYEAGVPVDYVFREVNPAFERQTGLVDPIGKRMTRLAPGHEPQWFALYGKVVETGETLRVEAPASRLGRFYEVLAWRFGDAARRQVAVLFKDVTERMATAAALARGERHLGTIIDEMPALISYIDRELRYVYNNKRYLDWYGVSPERLKGTRVEDLLGPARWAVVEGRLRRALAGETVAFDAEIEYPDRRRWVHCEFIPDPEPGGAVRGLFAFVTDITGARRQEETLKEAVSARTAELARSNAELEAFSYTVSHDLRAPLRAIQGYATIVLDRASALLDEETRGLLERISASTMRMDRMIMDLLALGRLSRGEQVLSPVDPEPVVDHVLSHYPGFDKADVTVRRPLGRVMAQDSLLTQALSNLLVNAVKFVPKGRRAAVAVSAEPAGPGRTRLVVEDNGLGIPEDMRSKLFRPFSRLHPRGEYEGTGIGLAIVKKAAERMGGTAGVESKPGDGSRFWIELRRAPDAA